MASKPADLPISTWAPSTSPLRVEYSTEAMEEIRARAVEGFYKLTRGGVEIAGVLLGEVSADTIRILAQFPFEIEYAYGPIFSLSPRDLAYVRKLIDDLRKTAEGGRNTNTDTPRNPGMRVLGFYVSHSRSALSMTDSEIALFQELFPHEWQTVLLLKPSRSPETQAAFFVREPDGQLRTSQSHGEFVVTPRIGERRTRKANGEDPSLKALAEAAARHPELHNARLRAMQEAAKEEFPEGDATGQAPPPPRPSAISDTGASANKPVSDTSKPMQQAAGAPRESPVLDASPRAKSRLIREFESSQAPPPPPVPEPPAAEPEPVVVERSELAPDQNTPLPGWAEEEVEPPAVRATHWLRWAIPSAGLLLLLVLGYLLYHAFNSTPPTVVFYARQTGENIQVIWQLKGISDARSAMITITTDGETRRIDLIRSGQLSGTYSDPFLKPTSTVRLDVERNSAPAIRRTAPIVSEDSAVASLDDRGEQSSGEAPARVEAEPLTAEQLAAPDLALQIGSSESIKATPVDQRIAPAPVQTTPQAATDGPPRPEVQAERTLTARELGQQRSGLASTGGTSPGSASAATPTATPPAPVRMTEAPARSTETPANTARDVAQSSALPVARPPAVQSTPSSSVSTPPVVAPPVSRTRPEEAQPAVRPPSQSAPQPAAPVRAETPRPPAQARVKAGRMIWTGSLKKNQTLEIAGTGASRGVVNSGLPGEPVRINVLPGELTPQGLVVYTANPKYRNAASAVEAPSSTNGWNQTRFRYDPEKANSVIVTAIPNQTNGWQSITVRNDDKSVNVIVVDWQVVE